MKISITRVFLALLFWVLLLVGVATFYFWTWLKTSHEISEQNSVHLITQGTNVYREAERLNRLGLLQWPKIWILYSRLTGKENIKAGEYRLSNKESPISLLNTFVSGDTVQYKVTLVEGFTFKDFLKILHDNEAVENTLPIDATAQTVDINGINVEHLEGWLFPDTYSFSRGDTDQSIMLRAHKKMDSILAEEWAKRSKNLPYETPYEALVMASIVEKETGVDFERPEIAGVFVRRLEKRMRLQTDPTVIYGMGASYAGNIRRSDLKKPTPYNTYVIKALPPTPIAMPGKDAIHAALNPLDGTSLYFVAKGDGSHYFSSTLKEHNEAVRKYQKNRKSNYRSSPVKPNPAKPSSSTLSSNNPNASSAAQ